MLFVILAPTGVSGAFPGRSLKGKTVSIIAEGSAVRAWPGGAGEYKLGANYAPTLLPQLKASREGWDQILWLNGETVTEAGSMNLFVVLKHGDKVTQGEATSIQFNDNLRSKSLLNPWQIWM